MQVLSDKQFTHLEKCFETWRHNNLINFIVTNVEPELKELCLTNLKPDIVIIDPAKKKLHISELTVPLTTNIDQRNIEKSRKYGPFVTDITGHDCTVNCFEVSSTGFISKRNNSHYPHCTRLWERTWRSQNSWAILMHLPGTEVTRFGSHVMIQILQIHHFWFPTSSPFSPPTLGPPAALPSLPQLP